MSNKLLIIGAGGLGRGVLELIHSINKVTYKYEVIGFVDDSPQGVINGVKYFGTVYDLLQIDSEISVVIAIGNPNIKEDIYNKLKSKSNIEYPNLIHPNVEFSTYNKLGVGNIISANVAMSTNIKIGNFNLIHYNCTIGHDAEINDFNSIYPLSSILGYTKLANNIEVGANSTVLPEVRVDNNVRIGAGAVVNKDIPSNKTVVGVPAKIIKG